MVRTASSPIQSTATTPEDPPTSTHHDGAECFIGSANGKNLRIVNPSVDVTADGGNGPRCRWIISYVRTPSLDQPDTLVTLTHAITGRRLTSPQSIDHNIKSVPASHPQSAADHFILQQSPSDSAAAALSGGASRVTIAPASEPSPLVRVAPGPPNKRGASDASHDPVVGCLAITMVGPHRGRGGGPRRPNAVAAAAVAATAVGVQPATVPAPSPHASATAAAHVAHSASAPLHAADPTAIPQSPHDDAIKSAIDSIAHRVATPDTIRSGPPAVAAAGGGRPLSSHTPTFRLVAHGGGALRVVSRTRRRRHNAPPTSLAAAAAVGEHVVDVRGGHGPFAALSVAATRADGAVRLAVAATAAVIGVGIDGCVVGVDAAVASRGDGVDVCAGSADADAAGGVETWLVVKRVDADDAADDRDGRRADGVPSVVDGIPSGCRVTLVRASDGVCATTTTAGGVADVDPLIATARSTPAGGDAFAEPLTFTVHVKAAGAGGGRARVAGGTQRAVSRGGRVASGTSDDGGGGGVGKRAGGGRGRGGDHSHRVRDVLNAHGVIVKMEPSVDGNVDVVVRIPRSVIADFFDKTPLPLNTAVDVTAHSS